MAGQAALNILAPIDMSAGGINFVADNTVAKIMTNDFITFNYVGFGMVIGLFDVPQA